MGIWRKSKNEYETMAQVVESDPGKTQAELARELDVAVSTIGHRLAGMEEAGILFSQDERGGLWPFGRRK